MQHTKLLHCHDQHLQITEEQETKQERNSPDRPTYKQMSEDIKERSKKMYTLYYTVHVYINIHVIL